jgi:hypothetical protein
MDGTQNANAANILFSLLLTPHQILRSSGNRTKLGQNLFSTPAPRVLNS